MSQRVLYQFPLSHYCEKVRWVLDYKRIPYRIHNQLPGFHIAINRRLTGGRSTVPLLLEGSAAISGSHAIALHLEAQHAAPSLLPRSAAGRALSDELVLHFDDVVGPAVRRLLYRFILARPQLFREVFFREYGRLPKLIGGLVAWPITKAIGKMYGVQEQDAVTLPEMLRREADAIDARLRHGSPFLIDDAFSLADVSVASLYGPLIGPPGSPWTEELDVPVLRTLRAELRERPVGRYITARYAQRFVSPEPLHAH